MDEKPARAPKVRQVRMTSRESGEIAEAALRLSDFEDATPEAAGQLSRYLGEVEFWSGKMHLVGKRHLGRSLGLLVIDSLGLLNAVNESGRTARRVADIGSGAGFPGIVWKIVRPSLDLTLFERRLKPQLFLERVVAQLGLEGITVIGEDVADCKETGTFDLVISKAAGRLGGILPLAERLLAAGGAYATVKGRSWEGEIPRGSLPAMRLESATELPQKRGTALIFRKITPA